MISEQWIVIVLFTIMVSTCCANVEVTPDLTKASTTSVSK
jgi:hypothetical protein